MKLYLFSSTRNKVCREEIEVTETPRLFIQKIGNKKKYYNKDLLDVPEKDYSCISMISTNGQLEHFIRKVIEMREAEIALLEERIKRISDDVGDIRASHAGIIEPRVHGNTYSAVSELHFEYEGDTIHASQSHDAKLPQDVPIHRVVGWKDFFLMMDNDPPIAVHHIFANGNKTNLVLDRYAEGKEGCKISFAKLIKMNEKVKLEFDIE